jgi:hypothetical protein
MLFFLLGAGLLLLLILLLDKDLDREEEYRLLRPYSGLSLRVGLRTGDLDLDLDLDLEPYRPPLAGGPPLPPPGG